MSRLWQIFQTVLGLIFRHPLVGTSIVPILPDGRVVLVQRKDDESWGLPGGLVDWGETIQQAAVREVAEETGLTVVSIRRLVGVYSAPDRDPRIHSVCIMVEAQVEGEISIQDTLEIQTVQAYDWSNLPEGSLSHDHRQQIDDYLQGKTALA
ncbi:MAG: NUDIX hydrolase [Roseofilum sp. SBFL]|uniref:NUDIX hydrolase n=1 Tax=unclassified Roseofilum TaxID=2620099 RepID=UPI001B05C19F|nr:MULTISPECIES: NUDIX hydrolase [unclassified Roseofilum]MBP0015441.1 NUDIX hydrolase [Roseofilum sp. SID3]MBP0023852.1 NUDIX hydrolase [Roseofilum sp. SID2]MBP0039711.1 NUDIX hydrolase [Roseofilum sp. SID1]MBP0044935.1 NUDIX hydrolase [Roseofilum sp. SBFL]